MIGTLAKLATAIQVLGLLSKAQNANDAALREHLISLLDGEQVHARAKSIVEGIPPEYRAKRARSIPYTLWDLLGHLRLAQHDILTYIQDPAYVAPQWPDDYWPSVKEPSRSQWSHEVKAFLADLEKLKKVIKDSKRSLFESIQGGEHTLLREILIVANHNSYHLGQMVLLRRRFGIW